MSSFFNELTDDINKGREGGNRGIPVFGVGLDKLSRHLAGIQPARYDLIGSNTGTGKTAFVDIFYVIGPLLWLYNNPTKEFDYNIIYNSLEISRARKLAKLSCLLLYLIHGLIVDWKELLSYNSDGEVLSDKIFDKVKELEPIMDFLESKITFLDGFVNPTRIHVICKQRGLKHGEVKYRTREVGSPWISGEAPRNEAGHIQEGYIQKYFRKDPNCKVITQVITDHIGLLSPEHESKESKVLLTNKKLIDKHSRYRIYDRDTYEISSVDVSQFNREISDMNRRRFEELTPQLEDFKETGSPTENADTVFALINPERYNIKKYKDFDITKIPKRFRALFILKDRNGADMITSPLRFIGECGHFCELPSAEYIRDNNLYFKIIDLRNKTLEDI